MSDDYQYRLMNEEDEWYMGPNGEDPDDDNQENKNKNLSLEEKLDTMIADLEDQKKDKEDEKRVVNFNRIMLPIAIVVGIISIIIIIVL